MRNNFKIFKCVSFQFLRQIFQKFYSTVWEIHQMIKNTIIIIHA